MLLTEQLAQGEGAVLFDRDVLWLDRQAFEHRLLEGDQLPEKAQRVLREGIPRREILRAATLLIPRSEEHTSELQSLAYLVCRLLLEKKKKKQSRHEIRIATQRHN